MRVPLLLLLTPALLLGSCKKDKDGSATTDTQSTWVRDLAGDTGASMADGIDGKERRPFQTFLYKLAGQQQVWLRNAADSAKWLKTTDWDLAFTGIYNGDVYVNNGSRAGNPGNGSTARGAIVLVDRPYDQVTEAPGDASFTASTISYMGRETANNAGWYNYSTTTHRVQPIKNRTFILRLPNGKFAKLELLNVYKGNPPAVTDLYWPAPYFTFRYFVQEDGSRNLKTT